MCHCEHLGAQTVKKCQIKECRERRKKHPYIDPKCYYSYTSTICTHDLKKDPRKSVKSCLIWRRWRDHCQMQNAVLNTQMVTRGSVFPRPAWDPIPDRFIFFTCGCECPEWILSSCRMWNSLSFCENPFRIGWEDWRHSHIFLITPTLQPTSC